MSINRRTMRYAHSEGHTDLCYTEDGQQMITCGNDGDIRTWLGLDDDEPKSYCVGESAFSVLQKGKYIYVCTDDNKVSILQYPEGERDGLLTRFTAPATHIATAKNIPILVCVSEDFTVKVLSLDQSVEPVTFTDAKGPALAVALTPNAKITAVSSGDGKMYIWNIDERKLINTIDCVPYSNSFVAAPVLCRMSFDRTGKLLAYPYHKEIIFVTTDHFKKIFALTASVNESFSIAQFSPCAKYLAASTIEGEICIWSISSKSLISTTNHPQKYNICSLVWNPTGNGEIAFCDTNGQLGTVENCYMTIDNDDINSELEEALNIDEGSDNENSISLEKLKNETLCPTSPTSDCELTSRPPSPVRPSTPPSKLQPPFQPSSTPAHLTSRFLVYNDVGIVQLYSDDDPSIDVRFHDASHFRNIYMRNHLGHTMASLSLTVLALACETPSKLVCIPLKTGVKEWSCEMPEIEEILCVTASVSLVAVATDTRMLRVFSIFGTQRAVISIPGPIVTLASRNNALVAVYHASTSYSKDQNLAALLVQFKGTDIFSKSLAFPLSPMSTLSWVGFTDVGSVASYDNAGILRLYRINSGVWIPVCDTNVHAKGASDFYFLTHVSETEQCLRMIHCKGSMYPVTIPQPILQEIRMQVPMCELNTDKAQFEEKLFRWSQFQVEQPEKTYKENSIKLFALACRSDLDDRAYELLEILNNRSLTSMGLMYANKSSRNRLVERITKLLQELNKEESENSENIPMSSSRSTSIIANETIYPKSQSDSENVYTPDIFSGSLTNKRDDTAREIFIPKPVPFKNPFLKKKAAVKNPLSLTNIQEEPESKPSTSKQESSPICTPREDVKKSSPVKNGNPEEETFILWFNKQKPEMEQKFPEMNPTQITQYALKMYKIHMGKRKATDDNSSQKAKQPKLSAFAFGKD